MTATQGHKRQLLRKRILYLSLVLFPITIYYFSPVIIVMGASKGIITASLFTFSLQFLTALYFGRAFCGWICPAGAIQEICIKVRNRKIPPGKGDLIKYIVVWIPWLTTIVILLIISGNIRIDPLFMTKYGISVSDIPSLISFLIVSSVFVIISLIFGRRASCHYICWMAPFMVLGTKLRDRLAFPGLRLKTNPGKCIECNKCSTNCPMSIDVQKLVKTGEIKHSECILCATCADNCPEEVISF